METDVFDHTRFLQLQFEVSLKTDSAVYSVLCNQQKLFRIVCWLCVCVHVCVCVWEL